MKTRMNVIDALIAALRTIDGRDSRWDRSYTYNFDLHGDAYYGFSEDVNSFPSVYIIVDNESVYSIGGGVRYSNLEIELRCYSYSDDIEESAEAITSDVEHVLDHYRLWDSDIDDVRIAQIETDGGINAPYGAAIIKAQVLFRR